MLQSRKPEICHSGVDISLPWQNHAGKIMIDDPHLTVVSYGLPQSLYDVVNEESGVGKMKVLLVQDIEKLGRAGEIKEVAGGFGRNYLIPKGFAVLATRGQVRQAEERMHAQHRREMSVRRDSEALATQINGKTVRFIVRVGELDRLYGSVTNADIAARLSEQFGIDVDRRKIALEDPIKRIGIYPVTVRLMAGVEPIVNVVVEAEGAEPEAAPKPESSDTPASVNS